MFVSFTTKNHWLQPRWPCWTHTTLRCQGPGSTCVLLDCQTSPSSPCPHLTCRRKGFCISSTTAGRFPEPADRWWASIQVCLFGSCQQKQDFIKRMLVSLFASLLLWEFLKTPMRRCHFSAKSNIHVISRQRTFEALVIYHSSFCSMSQAGQITQPFVTASTVTHIPGAGLGTPWAEAGEGVRCQDKNLSQRSRNFLT